MEANERRFFGRHKGKSLTDYQKNIFLNKKQDYDFVTETLQKQSSNILEIGFGGGEHLYHLALLHPENFYIGCEGFINGVVGLLVRLEEKPLNNLKIYQGDAGFLLKDLPDECFEKIYLLYPDPWHKRKHYKRRFIQKNTLIEIYRILKKGGPFYHATDIVGYAEWVLSHFLSENSKFKWCISKEMDWTVPFDNWISTRYEQKALREGRTGYYLTFQKQ